LAMTQQPILAMPTIANGALTLPETPSLAALVDWNALDRV
jgi:hypothetical protein